MNRAIAILAGCVVVSSALTATAWAAAKTRPTDTRLGHLPFPTVPTMEWISSTQQLVDALVEAERRTARAPLAARASADIQDVSAPSEDLPLARREVARMRASMRMCFRRSLETSDQLGELRISATVTPDGRVADIRSTNEGELPQALVDCALARVRQAEFEVSGDRGGRVEFTVVFSVGPADPE